jgi:hypothetical protein
MVDRDASTTGPVRIDLHQYLSARIGYFSRMALSVKRIQNNRFARMMAFVAVAAFALLLSSYCEVVDSAHAGTANDSSDHRTDAHGHGQPAPADTCSSLDHTPVVLPDAVSSPLADATPTFPPVHASGLAVRASTGSWRITPRATPPPNEPLPLYLRYVHLLI